MCSVVLSNIFKSELTTSDSPKHDCNANSKASMSSDKLNKENETVPSHESSITTRQLTRGDSDMKTSNRMSPQKSPGITMETGTEEQISENCFKIKGVIASSAVSPTWMHPTKLYSCFGAENSGKTEDGSTTELTKHSGAFEQLLSLASGKHLGIVSLLCTWELGTISHFLFKNYNKAPMDCLEGQCRVVGNFKS